MQGAEVCHVMLLAINYQAAIDVEQISRKLHPHISRSRKYWVEMEHDEAGISACRVNNADF
jgi:hypothetical protein